MVRLMQARPKPIGNSLKAILNDYGLMPRLKQFEIINAWSSIVGDQIMKVTKAEKVEQGTLFIRVTKPVWRNELIFLKKEIITKINKMMSEEIVKEIIFK
jgi:predicted nucleic acid-binding Zn ribbon protein